MLERFLIQVCLHATERELQFGSEKVILSLLQYTGVTRHSRLRRAMTQKTLLKKPRYIEYSSS